MRNTTALLATALAGGLALAAPSGLPVGNFEGTADWRGPGGSSGSYTVSRSFAGNTMTSRYAWNEGANAKREEYVLTLSAGAEPTFDVLDAKGRVVGKGHCYDDACSYRAEFGEILVNESLRWSAGEMSVLGSKSGPGFSVVWKETLRRR